VGNLDSIVVPPYMLSCPYEENLLSNIYDEFVAILKASLQHTAAIKALVEATAGIIFLTTPHDKSYVKPYILY